MPNTGTTLPPLRELGPGPEAVGQPRSLVRHAWVGGVQGEKLQSPVSTEFQNAGYFVHTCYYVGHAAGREIGG